MTKLQNDQQNKVYASTLRIYKYQVSNGPGNHKEVRNWHFRVFEFNNPGLTLLGYLIHTTASPYTEI